MDQVISNSAGLLSGERFGTDGSIAEPGFIVGGAGIPSGESFAQGPTGVRIDPFSVPRNLTVAY